MTKETTINENNYAQQIVQYLDKNICRPTFSDARVTIWIHNTNRLVVNRREVEHIQSHCSCQSNESQRKKQNISSYPEKPQLKSLIHYWCIIRIPLLMNLSIMKYNWSIQPNLKLTKYIFKKNLFGSIKPTKNLFYSLFVITLKNSFPETNLNRRVKFIIGCAS